MKTLPVVVISLLMCCSSALAQQQSSLIDQFANAFNDHDAARMASMVSDKFKLFYVDQEGKTELATTGPAALQAEMTQYFASLPSVRSTLDRRHEVGNYVSFRETAKWKSKTGQEQSQSSLAVYQIKDRKIHRVWYYPAQ